jgi:hypothetical protein
MVKHYNFNRPAIADKDLTFQTKIYCKQPSLCESKTEIQSK